MKALKLGLTAVLLPLMVYAYADNDPQANLEKSGYIKISLEDVKANRCFARDIYNQVDMAIFLYGGDQKKLIYAKVRHGYGIYLVFGKYREWENLVFSEGGMLGPPDK